MYFFLVLLLQEKVFVFGHILNLLLLTSERAVGRSSFARSYLSFLHRPAVAISDQYGHQKEY